MKEQTTPYIVQTVSHALDLLEEFRVSGEELGFTDLCNRLSLHKNNVFRLVATLKSRKYIEQNKSTGKYLLGFKVLELGQIFNMRMGLLRRARPVLEEVISKCNETVFVGILQDSHLVYLDCIETTHAVRVVPRVGIHLPAYCTAAGKSQLAYLAVDEIDHYINAEMLIRHTPQTITDRNELINHLHRIVEAGYAVENEEMDLGVISVAAPIYDYSRRIIGAVSISTLLPRATPERLEDELIPLIKKAGKDISEKLGYM